MVVRAPGGMWKHVPQSRPWDRARRIVVTPHPVVFAGWVGDKQVKVMSENVGNSRAVATGAAAGVLVRRIRAIVAFTIAYNILEAAISLAAGSAAGSGALIGFGLDSTIEVASAVAVAWQFSRRDPQKYEAVTLKIIAVAFFALALWVGAHSVHALVTRQAPESSVVGIVITAVSVVVMPTVSYLERQAGTALGSASAVADSRQTLMCAYLSIAVLVGLVLHSLFGWWWADPVAAMILAVVAVREGKEAWEGDGCALSTGRALAQPEKAGGCCGEGCGG